MEIKEKINKLYEEKKYREVVEAVDTQLLRNISQGDRDEIMLTVAWSHHQLGEYDKSIPIMKGLTTNYGTSTKVGERAWRGWAHGVLQRDGNISLADEIMKLLPPSPERDNIRMNFFLIAVRKGVAISASEIIATITNTLATAPYKTVDGHIINNGALTLHEAREQESVKPYLPILPGFNVFSDRYLQDNRYGEKSSCRSHIQSFPDLRSGWLEKIARIEAETSVGLWRELVSSQGGERYQQNLKGAEAQLKKLTQ